MANTQYITQENDRWDTIAVKAYGDCTKTQIRTLQNANPYLPITTVFKAGVKIVVPIIESEVSVGIDEFLPPWKRTDPKTDATQKAASFDSTSGSSSFDNSFG